MWEAYCDYGLADEHKSWAMSADCATAYPGDRVAAMAKCSSDAVACKLFDVDQAKCGREPAPMTTMASAEGGVGGDGLGGEAIAGVVIAAICCVLAVGAGGVYYCKNKAGADDEVRVRAQGKWPRLLQHRHYR